MNTLIAPSRSFVKFRPIILHGKTKCITNSVGNTLTKSDWINIERLGFLFICTSLQDNGRVFPAKTILDYNGNDIGKYVYECIEYDGTILALDFNKGGVFVLDFYGNELLRIPNEFVEEIGIKYSLGGKELYIKSFRKYVES